MAILQNNTGRRRAHLRGHWFSYHGLPATQPVPQTPSTGLRHPSLEEGAGKQCSECARTQPVHDCCLPYLPSTRQASKQASQRAVSDPAQRQHQAALRLSLTLVFLAESRQLGPLNASLAGDKSAPLHTAIRGRALSWRGRLHEQQHRRRRHCG